MKVKRITSAFIVEEYDTETGEFTDIDYVWGDDETWEDLDGNTIDEPNKYLGGN